MIGLMVATDTVASVLVYDRRAHNRRMTALLVTIAVFCIIGAVASASVVVAVAVRLLFHGSETLEWGLVIGTTLLLVYVFSVLMWSLASEPMSKFLSMIGARPPSKDEIEARRLIENLSIGAGLPVPKLYVVDTSTPNACAVGTNPSNSAVVVTSGLLELLETRELEGVLAHELSHIGNRDTRLNTIVAAIALFLRLPYLIRGHRAIDDPHLHVVNNVTYIWILMLPVRAYLFLVAPAFALLIQAAVSRRRESLADADATTLTRNPQGLMRALAKIAGAGSTVAQASPLFAHLYFANPLDGAAGPLAARLLDTHPPIQERIAQLSNFAEGVAQSEILSAYKEGEEFAQRQRCRPEPQCVSPAQDELSLFKAGNPAGRAFRLAGGSRPIPVYDQPDLRSRIVAHVMSGELLVVFDDPGPLREVVTQNQVFGYFPASARLERIDILPAEVFDSGSRADVMAKLTRQERV